MFLYSKAIKEAWDHKKSTLRNLKEMGLANDPNKVIKIPSFKKQQLKKAKQMVNPDDSESEEEVVPRKPLKMEVVEKLEKDAKAPKERRFM